MRIRFLFPAVVLLWLTACAVPRSVSVYDDECQAVVKKMVLDVVDVGRVGACSNQGCLHAVVGQLAGLAISTVVSGSIVVVGNVVYWLERRRNCPPPQIQLEARTD